jgi:hypothetical protein
MRAIVAGLLMAACSAGGDGGRKAPDIRSTLTRRFAAASDCRTIAFHGYLSSPNYCGIAACNNRSISTLRPSYENMAATDGSHHAGGLRVIAAFASASGSGVIGGGSSMRRDHDPETIA